MSIGERNAFVLQRHTSSTRRSTQKTTVTHCPLFMRIPVCNPFYILFVYFRVYYMATYKAKALICQVGKKVKVGQTMVF